MDRKGQMQIPFGMIFSILLIIAFIGIAFYAIKIFLNFQTCTKIGVFKEDLQESIDMAWNSPETFAEFKITLPSGIKQICFLDFSQPARGDLKEYYDELVLYGDYGMFFYPPEKSCSGLEGFTLRHINVSEITGQDNPYCVSADKSLRIEKGFYDALVKIK